MIIAFAHQKGGVGKSTIAFHVAAALQPDIIIDLDVHHSFKYINDHRDKPFNVVQYTNDQELHKLLQADDGLTLVDCGGFDSDINRVVLSVADLIIIPANDDITELLGITHMNNILAEISQAIDIHVQGHLLLNKVHPNRRNFDSFYESVKDLKHMHVMSSITKHRPDYPNALGMATGVTEITKFKYGKAAQEITALVKEIKKITTV